MQKPDSLSRSILEPGQVPTVEDVEQAIRLAVVGALSRVDFPVGIFLSGGVDSTNLLAFACEYIDIPVFTVAGSKRHADLLAAQRLAEEWQLEHYWWIPSEEERSVAREHVARRARNYPGDDGVYLACQFAARIGVKTLLATDGIDEVTGGYWWHANRSERFGNQLEAFEFYWRNLWPEHLEPLLLSAADCGLGVLFPYLDDRMISLLVRIPLEVRAPAGRPKAWWKALAAKHVPQWVIDRPKMGFVDALQNG